MKKLLFFIMGIALPVLSIWAQPKVIKPLTIGDTVPGIVFSNIINYKTSATKLSDLKGKVTIIDFWATWCGPCIAGLPKLDSLQQKYKNDLVVMPVSDENSKQVQRFLNTRKELQLPSAITNAEETATLRQLFPRNTIPHTILINPQGIVAAITNLAYITPDIIENLLAGKEANMTVKKTVPDFKYEKPLWIPAYETMDLPVYKSSLITARIEGLPSLRAPIHTDSGEIGFHAINLELIKLYAFATDRPKEYDQSRIVLEGVRDSSRYLSPTGDPGTIANWRTSHTFGYEIVAPHLSQTERLKIMLQDLNSVFGNLYHLKGSVDIRTIPCMILTAGAGIKKLASKAAYSMVASDKENKTSVYRHLTLDRLVLSLEQVLYYPIINETGSKLLIDLDIDDTLLAEAKKGDWHPLQLFFQSKGLALHAGERPLEVLLLTETN